MTLLRSVLAAVSVLLLSGCGVSGLSSPGTLLHGNVRGGQQPVSGTTLQLYAVGSSTDGGPAAALFASPIVTDEGGNFVFPAYQCPSPGALVYLAGTGGNPGLAAGTNNGQLAMMAALGRCGDLSASTFLSVNEVTTVGAVFALAPFLSGPASVGALPAHLADLQAAFSLAGQFVDVGRGSSPGSGLPAGYDAPTATINTLADVITPCINSGGGVSGDSTACGGLFAQTTPPGGVANPADTITSLLRVAQYPALNTAALYNLAPPAAPFQPALALQPADFSVSLLAHQLAASPSSLAFGSVLLGQSSAGLVTSFTNPAGTGMPLGGVALSGSNPGDFAITSTCPATLGGGSSCSVTVVFTPTGSGKRTATLMLPNAGTTTSVPLMGYGFTAISNNFLLTGNQPMHDYQPETLVVTNEGQEPLIFADLVITGAFTQTNNCQPPLAYQQSCSIQVTPAFNLDTVSSGKLSLIGNNFNTQNIVSLVSYGDRVVTFLSADVGTPSATQLTFASTYSTTGSQNPTYRETIGFSQRDAGDFSSPPCVLTAKACTSTVTFTPSAPGARMALMATNDGSYVGYSVVYGIGNTTGPAASFLPVNYLYTKQAATSAINYMVVNSGSVPLSFDGLASFHSSSDRAVFTATTCGSLPVHGNCTLTGTYTVGPNPNGYTVTGTETTTGLTFVLQQAVTVYFDPINVTPPTMYFPATALNTSSAPQYYTPSNANHNPIRLSVAPGVPFQITPSICMPDDTKCRFSIVFHPVVVNPYQIYQISVIDTYSLQGGSIMAYTTAGLGVLTCLPGSLDFGQQPVGSTSAPMIVTCTNTGDGVLNRITVPKPSGPTSGSDSDFGSGSGVYSLVPGASFTLSYAFSPTGTGVRDATVTIVPQGQSVGPENPFKPVTYTLAGSGK